MSLISDERVEELLAKEAAQEAEIARLRAGNIELADIIERALAENKKLRAALAEIAKLHSYGKIYRAGECHDISMIARKALAEQKGKNG